MINRVLIMLIVLSAYSFADDTLVDCSSKLYLSGNCCLGFGFNYDCGPDYKFSRFSFGNDLRTIIKYNPLAYEYFKRAETMKAAGTLTWAIGVINLAANYPVIGNDPYDESYNKYLVISGLTLIFGTVFEYSSIWFIKKSFRVFNET